MGCFMIEHKTEDLEHLEQQLLKLIEIRVRRLLHERKNLTFLEKKQMLNQVKTEVFVLGQRGDDLDLELKREQDLLERKQYVARPKQPKIIRLPGSHALTIFEYIYSRKTIERVFKMEIAEAQEDYLQAEQKKQAWRCRIIRVKTIIHLGTAVVVYGFTAFGKMVLKFWKVG